MSLIDSITSSAQRVFFGGRSPRRVDGGFEAEFRASLERINQLDPSRPMLTDAQVDAAVQMYADMPDPEQKKIMIDVMNSGVERTRQTLQTWRHAVQDAEDRRTPQRLPYLELVIDMEDDDQVATSMRNRKSRLCNARWQIVDQDGTYDPELSRLLNQYWFEQFLSLQLHSVYIGHVLLKVSVVNGIAEIKRVPPQNVEPLKGHILRTPYDSYGTPYRGQRKFRDFIEYDDMDGLVNHSIGLMRKVGLPYVYKKLAKTAHAMYIERAGTPMLKGRTMAHDGPRRKSLLDQMRQMGKQSSVLLSGTMEQEDIEVIELKNAQAWQLFDYKVNRQDEAIARIIDGQTMTSQSGSSEAQARVHQNTASEITRDDIKTACRRFDQIIEVLARMGYPFVPGRHRLAVDKNDKMSTKDQFETDMRLLEMGYKLENEEAYLREKYGAPVNGRDMERVQQMGSMSRASGGDANFS